MARPLRIEHAGAWYHITARGTDRKPIYRDERDYQRFCELLGEVAERFRWQIHAYVLMPNHFHLLVETLDANVSASMHWLAVSYSVWFNSRHRRRGHIFPGRFKGIVFDPPVWGLALSRWVHLNPVRVGQLRSAKSGRSAARVEAFSAANPALVRERLAVLRQFPWSSYRAYIGLARAPSWLCCGRILDWVSRGPAAAQRAAYRKYTEQAVRNGLAESPWEQVSGQVILGRGHFLRRMQRIVSGGVRRPRPALRKIAARNKWRAVVKAVEAVKGEKWEHFRNRYGDWGRDVALYLARRTGQLKLAELGRLAGGIHSATVAAAVIRMPQRLKKDHALAKIVDRVSAKL